MIPSELSGCEICFLGSLRQVRVSTAGKLSTDRRRSYAAEFCPLSMEEPPGEVGYRYFCSNSGISNQV